MKPKAKPKIAALALAATLAIPITAPISTTTAQATGIPTVDAAAIAQAILQVMESIQHTTALMNQYQTQLEQYENQLQHSLAPAAYIWEQYSVTKSKLEAAQGMLDVYDRQLGSIEGYLGQFKDLNWYKRSPCFSKNGCTPEEQKAMQELQERMSASQSTTQQKTNHRSLELLNKHLEAEEKDSSRVRRKQIQDEAAKAQGQLQAIGATNQFSALQSDQLIDIKEQLNALSMVLVQKAEAARAQRDLERATASKTRDTSRFKQIGSVKGWRP